MNRVQMEMAKKKRVKARELLLDTLSRLDDALVLQMMWAMNALQSDDPADVRPYLKYPKEAAIAQLGDKHFAIKWEIENLLLLMLSTSKKQSGFLRPPDYRSYDTVCALLNRLKTAERAEEKVILGPHNIIYELPRMAHKQFLWQRLFFEPSRLYRYFYVYGQGMCAKYFEAQYGLSMNEFAMACLVFYSLASKQAWQKLPRIEPPLKLRPEVIPLAMNLISMELPALREDTKKRIDKHAGHDKAKIAYLPSSLRQYPIITSARHNNQFVAPLPQLIIFRATSGLYYDLAGGPRTLLEEANSRFEAFGKKLIEARCPRFKVLRDQEYGTKAKRYRTPDLLLKDGETVEAVFECKATKLTFSAQYGEDQYAEAPKAFNQIAKGMSQLWKFFARVRRGIYALEKVAPDAHGIILTMENWFQIDRLQLPALRAEAEALCADEPDMLPQDKRDVIFCSIEALDDVLAVSNEDEVLETFAKSRTPEYFGWSVSNVRNPHDKEDLIRKDYPFNIDEVLPLWSELPD
ncbi:hypothetical protein [Sinorhizobium medicae]|uniref:hypothetical protein n=1 Tax=Sinorhizobium medicae TaxID=110321 RepID=UPI0011AEFB93|nr:hypothetical protein [Sinorhizobium medicae]